MLETSDDWSFIPTTTHRPSIATLPFMNLRTRFPPEAFLPSDWANQQSHKKEKLWPSVLKN